MTDSNRDFTTSNPQSTAKIGGHPIHPMLIPFPIVCFVGTFVVDLIYHRTGDAGWADASRWLLGFGLGTAVLAAITGLIDYMGDDRIRRLGHALQHMLANVAAVVVEVVNFVTRLGNDDGIVSLGVYLSGAAVLILLFSGWRGGDLVYVHRVGVHDRR